MKRIICDNLQGSALKFCSKFQQLVETLTHNPGHVSFRVEHNPFKEKECVFSVLGIIVSLEICPLRRQLHYFAFVKLQMGMTPGRWLAKNEQLLIINIYL